MGRGVRQTLSKPTDDGRSLTHTMPQTGGLFGRRIARRYSIEPVPKPFTFPFTFGGIHLEEPMQISVSSIARTGLILAASMIFGSSLAFAQATRTWVSGVGDDANPCSRTAPCKTYAGAISKTATGGEISTLDPGGFGGVTITKSITISGDGTLASVLVSGTNAIVINAPAGSVITLRNLSVIGLGTGLAGVKFLSGSSLTVENCNISGFTGAAVDVEPSVAAKVVIRESSLRTSGTGVQVSQGAGRVDVSIERTTISGAVNGVETLGGFTNVSYSNLAGNSGTAILGQGGSLSVEHSMLTNNNVAAIANGASTVRLSNNGVYDNLTGFGCGTGVLASTGDNRKGGNTGGAIPACSPNATITVQ